VHGKAPDATTESYTCKECQEKHYTADSLPDDLKLYKVEWCEAPAPSPPSATALHHKRYVN
jgi:hypothetical protein